MKYLMIKKFCELTGWTEKAVRCKIGDGTWCEGRQYVRAPDRHILINVEGYEAWV